MAKKEFAFKKQNKNPLGSLSELGRSAYNRATGSNLKRPQLSSLELLMPKLATVSFPNTDPSHYRPDGSPKGSGWLGTQKNSKGQDVSEYSVGVEIDGEEMDIPTIVPGMSDKDKKEVISSTEQKRFPSNDVLGKAVSHAKKQIQAGESPFNEPEESINTPSKRKAQRYETRYGMGNMA